MTLNSSAVRILVLIFKPNIPRKLGHASIYWYTPTVVKKSAHLQVPGYHI